MALVVLAGPTLATDITSAVQAGSLRVENSGGAQLATCQFDVVDKTDAFGSVLIPEGPVRVTDGGTTVFEGLIRTRERVRLAGEPKKRYAIGCQDYTSLLTDDVIDDLAPRSATESDKTRIEYWLSTYGTKGVTGGSTVQTISGSMVDQSPGGMTLYEALADTCRLTGARFYVGFDKALHYFVTETAPCAWDFVDASPNGSTTFAFRTLRLPDDTVELVNAVFVIGEGISGWVTDATSIAAYGRHEGTLRDATVVDSTSLTAAGNAYLGARAYPRQAATITYRKAGLVAGMTVHVTDARWGLSFVQFKVSKVTTTMLPGGAANYEAQLADAIIDLPLLLGQGDAADRKQLVYISQAGQIAQQLMGRVPVVALLPTLPDAAYPPGQLVLRSTDGQLYRNTADVWTPEIDAAYITGQIGPTQIADDSISTAKLQAGAVTANEILGNTITAGQIAAGAIGASALAAEIILTDKMIASGASGARVEIDEAGIRNYDATEALRVNIPTTGAPVSVVGQIEATSLVSTASAELRGATTLPGDAVATLQTGVSNPTAAPVVADALDYLALGSTPPYPGAGLCFDPDGGAGGTTDTYWIGADPTVGNLLDMAYEYDASSGALLRTIRKTGTTQTLTATLGATSHVADTTQAYSGTSNSQIANPMTFPARDNIQITKVSAYLAGYGGAATCRMAIWNTSGTSLRESADFTAAQRSFSNGNDVRYERNLTSPLAVAPSASIWAGFLHTSSGDGFFYSRDDGSGKTTKRGDGLAGSMTGIETDSASKPNIYVTYTYEVDSSVEGVTGKICGVARQGSYIWVLDANGKLFRYAQATLAFVDSFDLSAYITGTKANAGLYFDGTNLIITTATGVTASEQVKLVRVSTAGAYVSAHATTGRTVNGATDVLRGGYGDASWAVVAATGSVNGVLVYAVSTYAYLSDSIFGLAAEMSGGIVAGPAGWGAGWSVSNPTKVWKYTSWDWTTASAVFWLCYTWYDITGTTHETAVSPRTSITLGRRRRISVGNPAIPGGAGEPPDRVRVYMARGASDPGGANYDLQVTDALTSRILSTYDSGGAANPTSNSFPAGTPAELKSATTGWALKGSGFMTYTGGTSFPSGAVAGDVFYRTDYDLLMRYDGTRWTCTCQHELVLPFRLTDGYSATTPDAWRGGINAMAGGLYIDSVFTHFYVSSGTLNGTNTVTFATILKGLDGSSNTTIATVLINSGAIQQFRRVISAVDAAYTAANAAVVFVDLTITGSGLGVVYGWPVIAYRHVLT